MQVKIDGKNIKLDQRDVIGVGGEATVYKVNNQAVKVYLSPSQHRDAKLRAMMPLVPMLSPQVIAPQRLVYDKSGRDVLGFTMRLLESDYTEVRHLSNKKHRAMNSVGVKEIALLFLNAWETLNGIHTAGMVVGDLNDLNLMYRNQDMLFIDVDSFQFEQFACMVGTEAFTDPVLYGVDLTSRPWFKPENDWYSFTVLLFKSLLLTHPYGGVHKDYNLLTHRALMKISVLHPGVTYPRIAYSPELLSDDLMHAFENWFSNGWRGMFPADVLRDYISSLRECPSCKAMYPSNRAHCPMCATMVPVTEAMMAKFRTLIHAQGEIVAWHVWGNSARFITHEKGKVVLYVLDRLTEKRRVELFNIIPTALYVFLGDVLIISVAPEHEQLMVVDVSGDKPTPILKTSTDTFGNTLPVFGSSARSFYRIAGGYLMRGYFEHGELVERSVLAVAEGQTWFTVAPDAEKVFGFFRTINTYTHWLLVEGEHADVNLPPLEQGEVMLETAAKFASKTVLILRQTYFNGAERVRLDEVDHQGRLLASRLMMTIENFRLLDGVAYSKNMVLYATDRGVEKLTLDSGAVSTFTQTEAVVKAGGALFPYENGLLMIGDDRALLLTV